MERIKLEEATLNRIVHGHDEKGYAMISASRQDCLDDGKEHTEEEIWDENNIRTESMKSAIKKMGYSYIPVFGGYKEKGTDKASLEKAFIVFPYDMHTDLDEDFEVFESDMIHLGQEFNQDSVLIKEPNEKPRYYLCKEEKWDDVPFSSVNINDVQKEFFTALKGWKDTSRRKSNKDWEGTPQRFTYEESYLTKQPQSLMEFHRRRSNNELSCYGAIYGVYRKKKEYGE